MTELQEKLLEMLTWLHNFIIKHDLRYYALGGTMLGAVRHQGFIPWDDDIDIGLPRNDYNKLIELLKEPVEHYVVEAPVNAGDDYLYAYAKFYDTSTTMTERFRKAITRGVFIDLFPLDGIGNTLEDAKKNFKTINRKNLFLMTRICAYRKGRKWYKNMAIFFSRRIPSCFVNERKLIKKINELCSFHNFEEFSYVGNLLSTYGFKEILKREVFGQPALYNFENIQIYGAEKYEDYLSQVYGNWRVLPPVEKRQTAHDFIQLDLNNPYIR